jgi:hypothetical protein
VVCICPTFTNHHVEIMRLPQQPRNAFGMRELILIIGYLTAIAGLGWILHMIGVS